MRWFSWLVRLLPSTLREEYGADMRATLTERAADARRAGAGHHAWFVVRESAGLFRLAVSARWTLRESDHGLAVVNREKAGMLEHAMQEMRHALHRLRRTPGFTMAAIITLGLAVSANATIFTLLHRIVLAPLPYSESERLVALEHGAPGAGVPGGMGVSTGLYREYASMPQVESIALYRYGGGTLSGEAAVPERVLLLETTPSLAAVLRVQPALGRWFAEEEGRPVGAKVVVLSHHFWVNRFGADPAILGRTIRIDGQPNEVIGVMPEGFAFPDSRVQYYAPHQPDPAAAFPGGFNYQGIARMRAGVDVGVLRGAFEGIIAQLPDRFPEHRDLAESLVREGQLNVSPILYKERDLAGIDRTLWVLLGAVAILLLMAFANLTNLFLVRAEARHREVSMRRALGAGVGRIAGYYLSEALLIALGSAIVGLVLAHAAIGALVASPPITLPRLHEVRMDAVTVGYTLLLALVAGAGFGLLPLIRRSPGALSLVTESGRGATVEVPRARVRNVLMGAQVSLAVVLLIASTLMIRSFVQLQRVDVGFNAESRLVFGIGLPESEYDAAGALAFHEQMLVRLRALPGVNNAGLSTMLPFDGDGWGDPLEVRGHEAPAGKLNPVVRVRRVSPTFFEALDVPLLNGRRFDDDDMRGHSNPVIINAALARAYFPNGSAIGERVRFFGQEEGDWFTIVGVVGNTLTYSLRETEAVPKLYMPLRTQTTAGPTSYAIRYVLDVSGDPRLLLPAVRRTLAEANPQIAISRAEPLTDLVTRATATTAFTMLLLLTASAVALLLGLVGVYAVIAYTVARRAGEIGVRLALGARPADVTRMIVRQSGRVIAIGVLLGLVGAIAGAGSLRALVFNVPTHDVVTYAGVAVGLYVVALIACWIPAQRAARLNPIETMQPR